MGYPWPVRVPSLDIRDCSFVFSETLHEVGGQFKVKKLYCRNYGKNCIYGIRGIKYQNLGFLDFRTAVI